MRVVFLGTPEFAAQSLAALISTSHDICAAYTQPPRKAGRGYHRRHSQVHKLAQLHDIDVYTPTSFKAPAEIEKFISLKADIGVVVAYGQLLPREVLEAPEFGCINLHASLLPRWRGAAPIQRAIMAGDKYTGVQVMQMDTGLDTGSVLFSQTAKISSSDTYMALHDRLAEAGARLLPLALNAIMEREVIAKPQSKSGITYAHKIKPVEARVDWRQPATIIDRHIRGLSPFPGAWTEMPGRDDKLVRIKILDAELIKGSSGLPGEIVKSENQLYVACGEGGLALRTLQRPGKTVQSAETFLRGFPIAVGSVLL